ncbi:MAG: hypothetical protein HY864_00725 [Chloroflexi bacterium]|nr:hypothetical protein [Chloroflexota bacterium]
MKENALYFVVLFIIILVSDKYLRHRMSRFEITLIGLIIGIITFYISAGIGRLLGW